MSNPAFGMIEAYVRLLIPSVRASFKEMIDLFLAAMPRIDGHRALYLMVGYSKSGKRTFIQAHPTLRVAARVDTDRIHQALRRRFPFLRDDDVVGTRTYWLRQALTHIARTRMLKELFKRNTSIVSDSCNLSATDRAIYLRHARRAGYWTVIIWLKTGESVLRQRLEAADRELRAQGRKPVWVDLYERVQKPRFSPPTFSECDQILPVYDGDLPTDFHFEPFR